MLEVSEQTQPNQPAQPQVQTEPKKGISWKKIIITVVVVIVVSGVISGLIWYFGCYQTESTPASSVKVSTPSSSQATPSAQKNETADWETYAADDGVSFKYPSSWTLNKVSRPPGKTTKDYVSITSPKGFLLQFVTGISGLGGGGVAMIWVVNTYLM
ncbi:MAG: hypothetical protein A2172_04950 [Candidatus Woykebacteria bacterium RBG_13_40_15]|uniref:Uncharacterized protein n=1 Tax=Candidatus Woykebacteria bacterium RBG_13_40_15 TaxID=1802593 RepID=A0A1G1W5B2_9BACT|nr:MAG: hypothetical protein A2172_04950 [Candidatus Woykebacteria bacterium RBG_13_40_15]